MYTRDSLLGVKLEPDLDYVYDRGKDYSQIPCVTESRAN